jgi:hypothetical protein
MLSVIIMPRQPRVKWSCLQKRRRVCAATEAPSEEGGAEGSTSSHRQFLFWQFLGDFGGASAASVPNLE